MYITPITKIHSTYAEAKGFFTEYGGVSLFDAENPLKISDLAQGKRNLIVGEPGIGKTFLLQQIQDFLDWKGFTTALISLRQTHAAELIDEFLVKRIEGQKVLLLDALDEARSSLFPSVLQKIEEVSAKYPELSIYLSSRWVFISRYPSSFPEYRFITISPFTREQVRTYLIEAGRSEGDVDALLNRVMSFNHRQLVIQIPRYLSYLDGFLKLKGVDAAAQVSRNELFEHFIYSKLELEDKKLSTDKKAITKRVLEKLALTMEIYQSNTISKDDLMTFFDELKSDLKQVALAQINLDVFYEYSLLKVGQKNLDDIEFENTEFQEYLAAKEITRLSDPGLAAFGFAVDPDAKEIYPTWFNALTFLVDMQNDLLGQLVEFSGIRADGFKVVDEGFLKFLSRVDPKNVPKELRRQLFTDFLAYHQKTRQWMNWDLASALPGFFDSSLEVLLKDWAVKAESESGAKRYVPLGNIACVVGSLLTEKIQLDRPYWRSKLLAFAADQNDNGVLQRHALFALGQLGDPTVIDEVPDLMSSGELIVRAFLSMCTELDPENQKSLGYFFKAIKMKEFHGRYGLFAVKRPSSIKKFLETFNSDKDFRQEFLEATSIFKESDSKLVEHIEAVVDDEIAELGKETLVHSAHYNVAHEAEKSFFTMGMWDLLKKVDPNFILDMVNRIHKGSDGKVRWYYAEGFFAKVMNKEDVPTFIDAMVAVGQRKSAFHVMLRVRALSGRSEIFEAGRAKLSDEYGQLETAQANLQDNGVGVSDEELLREFRVYLEPELGKYSPKVFEFYNEQAQRLDPLLAVDDRSRLSKLLTETVFKIDPVRVDLTMTAGGYTTSTAIDVFRDAIGTAKQLGIDITPFRQHILNFIPFAYHEQLRMIFELVKNIKPLEIKPVLAVYKERQSDLWRYRPSSFVEAVEQYHVIEAVPILKEFVKEPACDKYARRTALTVLDSLVPDASFLKEVFELYKNAVNEDEKLIAQIANGLMITPHGDGEAIRWRLRQVVESAGAFDQPRGAHWVGNLENEIIHDKSFAKPLMELSRPGYENDYLGLLDEAMALWGKGKEYYAYAEYLWNIVYAYVDNLKIGMSYDPLRLLEKKIVGMKDRDGANWLAGRMVHLRRSYLGYLGKPRNISEAILKYNDSRSLGNKKIQNSVDLFRHLQDAFDDDLRRWIEGEGAYDLLRGEKVFKTKKQEYEKLIQKTLKPQIENVLLRRGFQVEVIREPQLLDEKRTDFLVRYGFAGPIVVEVKLTSNSDIKGSKIAKSASYVSMMRYMNGYGASHGIFLLIDNCGAKNLAEVKKTFETIPNVLVQSFDCPNPVAAVKRRGRAKAKAGNRASRSN